MRFPSEMNTKSPKTFIPFQTNYEYRLLINKALFPRVPFTIQPQQLLP